MGAGFPCEIWIMNFDAEKIFCCPCWLTTHNHVISTICLVTFPISAWNTWLPSALSSWEKQKVALVLSNSLFIFSRCVPETWTGRGDPPVITPRASNMAKSGWYWGVQMGYSDLYVIPCSLPEECKVLRSYENAKRCLRSASSVRGCLTHWCEISLLQDLFIPWECSLQWAANYLKLNISKY